VTRRPKPLDCLAHQWTAQSNALIDLLSQGLESRVTQHAGVALLGPAERRIDGEMIAGMKCHCLRDDLDFVSKVLKLFAHPVDVLIQNPFDRGRRIEKPLKSSFYNPALADPRALRSSL
jgi:hypothetical protein